MEPARDHSASASGDPAQVRRSIARLRMAAHALRGESVIDMQGFVFPDLDMARDLLETLGFDLRQNGDQQHLRSLEREAALYLAEQHGYQIPSSLERPDDLLTVFTLAGADDEHTSKVACMMLKVMHTIHHLECRELVSAVAVPEVDLLSRLNTRVFAAIDRMRAVGVAVDEFSTGQKSRKSLLTKLLAKRSASAAEIFDKLRFRIVFRERRDVVLGLLFLLDDLVPFNFVIPSESQNRLISMSDLLPVLDLTPELLERHAPNFVLEPDPDGASKNEFSGKNYRCINLVADIPLRAEEFAAQKQPPVLTVRAEIQLVDSKTEVENNKGENSHSLYKKRQRDRVKKRLEGVD